MTGNNKFDNHVFLVICEASLERSSETGYSTYLGYCGGIKRGLEKHEINNRDLDHLAYYMYILKLIFNMNKEEALHYIEEYFKSSRIIEFERVVRMTKETLISR